MSYFTSLVTRALRSLTASRCETRPALKRPHNGRQDRALHRLISTGEITLAEIGGNCPAKVVMCLREKGYLVKNGAPQERWETNPRTGCDYKVYIWTGKVPAKWVQSESYTGKERRTKPRGNR